MEVAGSLSMVLKRICAISQLSSTVRKFQFVTLWKFRVSLFMSRNFYVICLMKFVYLDVTCSFVFSRMPGFSIVFMLCKKLIHFGLISMLSLLMLV